MASLGELFIELGVVGDTKELDKMNKKLKETVKAAEEAVKAVQEEITHNDKLNEITEKITKATEDYNNATTEEAKATAKAVIQAAEAQKIRLEELKTKKEALRATKEELQVNQENIDANKALANNVAKVVKGIAGFATAVSGAIWALNKLTNQLVQSNQEFLNLTRTSDISLKTFQKWDSVGKMLGVQNAADQIEGLNERLFELMLTGEGARGFQLAGINPIGQDAEGVLEQIRSRISGLSDTSASYLLKQMGLDPQMLHLLRMSREEFESLNAEMARFRLTSEQRASIQQMNIQLQIASQKLQYLKDRAILAIMPAWTRFVENMAFLVEVLARAGAAIGRFMKKWGLLIGAFTLGIGKIPKVAKVFKSLSGIFRNNQAAMLRLMRLVPVFGRTLAATAAMIGKAFLPITAILAGLYLLLDDIIRYNNGGGSVIGVIAKGLEDLDIKGFLDFPIPKWLEALIRVIDFFNGNAGKRADKLAEDRLIKAIDPNATKAINPDGSEGGWASVAQWKKNPNPNMFLSPEAQRSITNNYNRTASTNSNNTIYQHNYIETQQPAQSILEQLGFTQFAFS